MQYKMYLQYIAFITGTCGFFVTSEVFSLYKVVTFTIDLVHGFILKSLTFALSSDVYMVEYSHFSYKTYAMARWFDLWLTQDQYWKLLPRPYPQKCVW